ncbi:MAG TPA: Nramp family divalent metal transporter [Chryseolinea sp.]
MKKDPYVITEETIREPPSTLVGKLKFLGPGFILSASIVGSGELIATTVLGAKAGFAALWIILVSCLMKVAVQLEFGKHTILTGEPVMKAFNKLPGIRFGKGSWSVWLIFIMVSLKIVQVGGMLGGAAIILNKLFSEMSITVCAIIVAVAVASLIFKGNYSIVEKGSLIMIGLFTVMTFISLYFVQYTPYSFSFSDVLNGFQFNLSDDVIGVAIGAFGITGVASDEIIAYNYWCLEKGYAAYAGPRANHEVWKKRAEGWIATMYVDAIVAMIIYTTVTVTFYLLGSSILHNRGEIPEGNEVIDTLALIYTQSLGEGIRNVYLVGAFFVLFSSVYATLAFWTRLFPDIFAQLGWLDFYDTKKRKQLIALISWTVPFAWAFLYLFIELPVMMVLFGGVVGSLMLFIVVFGAYHFKYGRLQPVPSSRFYNLAFWISVISIVGVGVYGVVQFIF